MSRLPAAPAAFEIASAAESPTPKLNRRLACLIYEGVLLLGIVMAAGLSYGILADQRDAMLGRHGLQATLFVVLGAYFTWLWSHGGQTLAMKTWRIRLLNADGTPVQMLRALARYLLAWLWFAPALLSLGFSGVGEPWAVFAFLGAGVLGYAALTQLRADRQFWHDAVCGTRLVTWPTPTASTPSARQPIR